MSHRELRKTLRESWPYFYDNAVKLLTDYKAVFVFYVKIYHHVRWQEQLNVDVDSMTSLDVLKELTKKRYLLDDIGADQDLFAFVRLVEKYVRDEPRDLDEKLKFAYWMNSMVALLPLHDPITNIHKLKARVDPAYVRDLIDGYIKAHKIMHMSFKRFHRLSVNFIKNAEGEKQYRDANKVMTEEEKELWEKLRRGLPDAFDDGDFDYRVLEHKEPAESVRIDRLLGRDKIDGWSWSLIRSNTPRIALMERTDLDMVPIDDMKKPNLALQQTHGSLAHTVAEGVEIFILIHPEVSRFIDASVCQKIHPTVFWKMYPQGPPKTKKKKKRAKLREDPEVNSPSPQTETQAQTADEGEAPRAAQETTEAAQNASRAAQPPQQPDQNPAQPAAAQQLEPFLAPAAGNGQPAHTQPAHAEAQSSQTAALQFPPPAPNIDRPAEAYGNLGAADREMWPPGFRAFNTEANGEARQNAAPAADAQASGDRKRPGDSDTSSNSSRKRSKNRDTSRERSADSWRTERKEKFTARHCWKIAKKKFRQFNQRHGRKIIDYLQFALDTVCAPVVGSYVFCTQGFWPQGLFPAWPQSSLESSDNRSGRVGDEPRITGVRSSYFRRARGITKTRSTSRNIISRASTRSAISNTSHNSARSNSRGQSQMRRGGAMRAYERLW